MGESKCCIKDGKWHLSCYEKNDHYAQCMPLGSCIPGIHHIDPEPYRTHWTCMELDKPDKPTGCSLRWANCIGTLCCPGGYTCYEKHANFAQCIPTGKCPHDPKMTTDGAQWSCNVLTATQPPQPPQPPQPSKCVDEDRNCRAWATQGECEQNPEYMH